MKNLLLLTAIICATTLEVKAETKAKVSFTDSKGVSISVSEAIRLSDSGEAVYRCQPVKAAPNKSGTSITFKVAK